MCGLRVDTKNSRMTLFAKLTSRIHISTLRVVWWTRIQTSQFPCCYGSLNCTDVVLFTKELCAVYSSHHSDAFHAQVAGWINPSSSEKQNHKDVYRNRNRLIIRSWLTWLWRLTSFKICRESQQAGDPGDTKVQQAQDPGRTCVWGWV